METQRSPLLNWPYYYQFNYQGKSMEELKNLLICTTLELETTKLAAQEEIRKREEQLVHFQELLNKAITERNEAQENCKVLLLDKLLLQQQQKQHIVNSGSSSSNIEEELTSTKKVIESNHNKNNNNNNVGNFTSSDCEESIISSPQSPPPPQQPPLAALPENAMRLCQPRKHCRKRGAFYRQL
ncbi:Lipoate--protein ligase [Bienertia sinuspersici]